MNKEAISVVKSDGSNEPLDITKIQKMTQQACVIGGSTYGSILYCNLLSSNRCVSHPSPPALSSLTHR